VTFVAGSVAFVACLFAGMILWTILEALTEDR